MGKKIITLLLCMLMVIGMLSSFTVFAEGTNEPVVIYEINYNSDADLAADKIICYPANAAASIDTAEHFEGAGSLKLEFDKDSTKDVRLCNINGTAFKKGANYVVSFYAKASAPVNFKFMCDFTNNGNRIISGGSEIAYPGAFPKLTTDWKKYTIRFNIDSFKNGNDEYVAKFLVEANNFSAGDKLWIDKIEVLEGINPVAPVAENVKISGSAQVSKTLTASADITDANNGDILSAKYQWQYQDGEVWKDISGAASETYTIPEEMLGKKLRVLVTPLSDNEPKEGVPVASAATGEITAFSYPPSVKDVKLSGEAKIGSTIEASYIYMKSESNIDEGDSDIIWETSESENGTFTPVKISSGKTYTVQVKDAGFWLRARVIPRDKNGSEGAEAVSSAVKISGEIEFFVSANGSDANVGTKDAPFATIEKARDAVREFTNLPDGGITVNIMGGTYPISNTVQFTQEDSGTEKCPIVYQAYNGEKVEFIGGQTIESFKLKKVTDESLLNRLIDKNAKSKLMMVDLSKEGINMTDLEPYGWGYPNYRPYRFFMNNTPFIDARWPNDDESQCLIICKAFLDGVDTTKFNGNSMPAKIQYPDEDNRTNKWSIKPGDAYIGGAVVYFWASVQLRIDNLDTKNKIVTTMDKSTYSLIPGAGWGQQHKIFFANIFEEIDQPGESYVDRENNILYFYPVGSAADSDLVVSTLKDNMITANKVSNVTFRGIDFKDTVYTPVVMTECNNISFENSEISNTSDGGITLKNCKNTKISGCHFKSTAASPVAFSGGDRKTLTPSGNIVENNYFHNFSQMPHRRQSRQAIQVNGCCGEIIRHNEFNDFGYGALDIMSSNDIVFEYNKVINGELRSTDAGTIYWGDDITTLGIVIRYNYFENIGSETITETLRGGSANSVFWDDAATGPQLYGNVFFNGGSYEKSNLGAPFSSNGGEFADIHGNISISTNYDRCGGFAGTMPWENNSMKIPGLNEHAPSNSYLYNVGLGGVFGKRFETFVQSKKDLLWSKEWIEHYKGTNWGKSLEHYGKKIYDGAKALHDAGDKDGLVKYLNENLTDKPTNDIYSNAALGATTMNYPTKTNVSGFYTGTKGKITDEDKALFVDYDGKNFTLTPEGLAKIQSVSPEFEAIPFEKIGLTIDIGVHKPEVTIKPEQILGVAAEGNTISPSYTFYDADGDAEGASKIYWYVSDRANGQYRMISGKQGRYFDVTEEFAGRYLKYEYIPYDTDVMSGDSVWSQPILVRKGGSVNLAEISKAIAEATELFENAVVGTEEGMYEQASVDALNKAISEASAAAANADATQYQINRALSDLNVAVDEFKASVISKLEYLNVSDMLKDTANWKFMNPANAGEFKNGELRLPANAIATYTGRKYLNSIFTFKMRFEADLPEGAKLADYSGNADYSVNEAFYVRLAEPDTNIWNGRNTGYLLWFKNTAYEAQEWNPTQTLLSYQNDFFTEYNRDYEIAMGAYDTVNGVRYVMYVDNKLVYNHTFSKEIMGKEGHVRFGATGGGSKVAMVISSGNVDFEELDYELGAAKAFIETAKIGDGYGEYSEEALKTLKDRIANAEALKADSSASQLAVNKLALSVKSTLSKVKALVNTEAYVNSASEFDVVYGAGSTNLYVTANVPVALRFKEGYLSPGINLSVNNAMGTAALNILEGSKLSGTAAFTNPVIKDNASGSLPNGISVEGVYSTSNGFAESDVPVRLLFPGAAKCRVYIKDKNGKYSEVKIKLTEDDAYAANKKLGESVAGKLAVGNDLVVYTKGLSEFVLFKAKASDDNPEEIPGVGGTGSPSSKASGGGSVATGATIGSSGSFVPGGLTDNSENFCFDDVKQHWAENDIMYMYKIGIVSGVTERTFEPERSITRAEFATLIAKALKLESGESRFSDVSDNDWFAEFVNKTAAAGIIVGSDGKFRPNDKITREEMAVVIVNAYEYLEKSTTTAEISFADNDEIASWAKEYVEKAVAAGLLSGMDDGAFAPKANATRAQAAAVISRIIK